MLIQDCMEDYINYIEMVRGLSPGTIKRYEEELNLFIYFLKEKGLPLQVEEITIQHLREYLVYMKRERNNSPVTIKNKIAIIKIFFEFLCKEGVYG